MLAGNTDCYQPIERKLEITRNVLKTFLKYRNPVAIITKNNLILRDLDILSELAKRKLVVVMVSITTMDEKLRRKLEPRTVTGKQRMRVIRELSAAGVHTGIMTAPIIPGLNSHEVPEMIRLAAENGGKMAGSTMVRLNGALEPLFHDWLYTNYPDRADKVWNHICAVHGGKVSEKRYGKRMTGEGKIAESIHQMRKVAVQKYMGDVPKFTYDLTAFRKEHPDQYNLFED